MSRNLAFRPQSRTLALEPRILFDGAAAVAVDQQASADHAPDAPQAAPEAPPRTLVVIDTRIDNYKDLAAQAATSADIVLVGAGEDGLKAIADALAAGGKVDSIQILSHGAAGQFSLGSRTVSADNVATLSDTLRAWAPQLTADADILLYGCGIGAGESGRALITALAIATGADVAASTNDTGSTSAGGDWTLEVATGAIESGLAAVSYDGLLADASPTVALSGAATDALLGGTFSFTATFTNASTQAGYAPFIDLILPATGKDGAGTEIDDGITFVSATFLGQTVTSYVITFDAAGNATHPLAMDASGTPVVVNAATYGAQAGDQLVVLQLPFASVLQGQPAIDVVVTCKLSELADTDGSPQLTVKARGGFQFGNDSANNPTVDPSLFEAVPRDFVVTPTVLTLAQTVNVPEGETATGPQLWPHPHGHGDAGAGADADRGGDCTEAARQRPGNGHHPGGRRHHRGHHPRGWQLHIGSGANRRCAGDGTLPQAVFPPLRQPQRAGDEHRVVLRRRLCRRPGEFDAAGTRPRLRRCRHDHGRQALGPGALAATGPARPEADRPAAAGRRPARSDHRQRQRCDLHRPLAGAPQDRCHRGQPGQRRAFSR